MKSSRFNTSKPSIFYNHRKSLNVKKSNNTLLNKSYIRKLSFVEVLIDLIENTGSSGVGEKDGCQIVESIDDSEINSRDINGRSLLHCAAWKGYSDMVTLLLKKGAFINMQDNFNYTPLFLAVSNGFSKIVLILLNNDAATFLCDNSGTNPLMVAASKNFSVEVWESLLKNTTSNINNNCINETNDKGDSALLIAKKAGNTNFVKLLIEYGAVDKLSSVNQSNINNKEIAPCVEKELARQKRLESYISYSEKFKPRKKSFWSKFFC